MSGMKGFSLYLYAPSPYAQALGEYSAQVEQLRMTSVSPGGYGQFEAFIKLRDADLLRPELAIFNRIALQDASVPEPHGNRWLGEMTAPELGYDDTNHEYLHVVAEGIGASLRDDPGIFSYSGKTPQQVIADQMTTGNRSNYLIIDADQSGVFPDNPGALDPTVYEGNTIEEIIADQAGKAGDYAWGVWAHPTKRDSYGFPTGQLQIHLRDVNAVSYMAYDEDVWGWKTTPSIDRAINVVAIGYNDYTATPPVGAAMYTDPRLAANGSQGTAPFRRRKYYRNLAGVQSVTAAQALKLANTYGAQWQNLTFTTQVILRRLRDANGNVIPPWQALADKNIFLPALTRRGAVFIRASSLATSPTPGVNEFYIRQTEYLEGIKGGAGDGWQLTLQLDNFWDRAQMMLARLQLAADTIVRLGQSTTGVTQQSGAPVTGVGGSVQQASGASQTVGCWVTFPVSATSATPTSITLGTPKESINVAAATTGVSNLSTSGFELFWQSAAAGKTSLMTPYTTVGNCLLGVDEARETFDHHCDYCAREGLMDTRRGLSLRRDLVVDRLVVDDRTGREEHWVRYYCPNGHSEHFCVSELAPEAEDETAPGGHPHRAEQARHIRRIGRFHGLAVKEREADEADEAGKENGKAATRKRTRRRG